MCERNGRQTSPRAGRGYRDFKYGGMGGMSEALKGSIDLDWMPGFNPAIITPGQIPLPSTRSAFSWTFSEFEPVSRYNPRLFITLIRFDETLRKEKSFIYSEGRFRLIVSLGCSIERGRTSHKNPSGAFSSLSQTNISSQNKILLQLVLLKIINLKVI